MAKTYRSSDLSPTPSPDRGSIIHYKLAAEWISDIFATAEDRFKYAFYGTFAVFLLGMPDRLPDKINVAVDKPKDLLDIRDILKEKRG